jgi:membrane-bound metal-dependent hydrolase YbcI (DUF457 family)
VSGFRTHMLIGAVGGLALVTAANHLAPSTIGSLLPGQPRLYAEALIISASAVAATLPDIDEPGSWLSRRVHTALALLGLIIGGAIGLDNRSSGALAGLGLSWTVFFMLCLGVGLFIGSVAGWALLRLIRAGAGGHRAGTHSVFFGGGLVLLAVVLQLAGKHTLALAASTLAWGWALHLVGDVVTPYGWRPFSPVSDFSLRLPRPIAHHGERMVVVAAVLVAALLFRIQ